MEMYYAIPATGAVCHTLNIRLSVEQLVYIIEHAGDRIVFVDASLAPVLEPVRQRVTCVEHYVIVNQAENDPVDWPDALEYESLLAAESSDYQWLSLDENTAAGLCYTSGTTGHPKGALYSHRSTYLHALYSNQANALAFRERDRVLAIVPQFHVMGWGFPYSCFSAGADIILPGKHMDPASLADLLIDEHITVANGVPTIWTGVYDELKKRDRKPDSIRALIIGGSAMPKPLMEAYERDFGIAAVHAWGMTEMSPLGTLSLLQRRHQDLDRGVQRQVRARQGLPMPGVELRIVDDSGRIVARDDHESGEIQVRGACIIRHYYKREPDPEHFTEDGWFRTGDVATINDEYSIPHNRSHQGPDSQRRRVDIQYRPGNGPEWSSRYP